jgi:class 3 adenylate cyclase
VGVRLPSGIVTFVLTDIEGSTRLLRRLGPRYGVVLDRHVELLREAWEGRGGALVSTSGDSCFAAFGDPAAAVEACADAPQRIRAEPWPEDGVPPRSVPPCGDGGQQQRRLFAL